MCKYTIIFTLKGAAAMRHKNTKHKDSNSTRIMESVADTLKLPKDLMLGAAILTVTGQCEAYVENYSGIIEYTDKKIKLQTKTCRMEINGRNLKIIYYTNDDMKITGYIEEIKYQN